MKAAQFKIIGLSVFFFALCSSAQNTGHIDHVFVRIPKAEVTQNFVLTSGFIRDHGDDDTYAFGYLTPDSLAHLSSDLKAKIVPLNAWDWATKKFDTKSLKEISVSRAIPDSTVAAEDYHTYETLTSELQGLAAKYPTLMTVTSAGKSVQGRDLWYVQITSNKLQTAVKPNLLYISSMHGDEVVGKELLIYFMRDLLASYGTDSRKTALVDHAVLFIMPSMNPDGTFLKERFNANGIDLNRNFPGMTEDPFDPNRAPETEAIIKLHKQYHFTLALNMHTGAVCFNIPWDSKANDGTDPFGDDKLISTLAHQYADANQPMHDVNQDSFTNGVTYGYEWYQVLGGMQDWADFFQESTHATLELSDIKWPDYSTLPQFWSDNQESIMSYFEGGLVGFHLMVTDAQGNLLDAGVDMGSATRTLHYHGYVNRPATGASQTVTVSATGLQPQTLTLTPSNFDGTFQTVVLTKAAARSIAKR